MLTECLHEVFTPTVKIELFDRQLPERCFLVMDSALAHPTALVDDTEAEYDC